MLKITNKEARKISIESGISFRTIRSRVDRGWSREELTLPANSRKELIKGSYFGKMMTCKELAKISNLDNQTIRSRIQRGCKDGDLVRGVMEPKDISRVMLASRNGPKRIANIMESFEEEKELNYGLPLGNSVIGS